MRTHNAQDNPMKLAIPEALLHSKDKRKAELSGADAVMKDLSGFGEGWSRSGQSGQSVFLGQASTLVTGSGVLATGSDREFSTDFGQPDN